MLAACVGICRFPGKSEVRFVQILFCLIRFQGVRYSVWGGEGMSERRRCKIKGRLTMLCLVDVARDYEAVSLNYKSP